MISVSGWSRRKEGSFIRNLKKKEIEKQADEIEFYIRKAAHMTEYAVLTLLVAFGFYVNGFRRKRWLMVDLFSVYFMRQQMSSISLSSGTRTIGEMWELTVLVY